MSSRIIHHTENHHTENHSTQTTLLLIILVTIAATFVLTPAAHAQDYSTIPLGTISDVDPLPSCPSGFYTGMTWEQLTVSCPSTDTITVTVGYVGPTVLPTPKGTIVSLVGVQEQCLRNPAQTSCRSTLTTSRITRS